MFEVSRVAVFAIYCTAAGALFLLWFRERHHTNVSDISLLALAFFAAEIGTYTMIRIVNPAWSHSLLLRYFMDSLTSLTLLVVVWQAIRQTRQRHALESVLIEHENKYHLLKQHLIVVVAHELKTPITVLRGYAQLLLRLGPTIPSEVSDEKIGYIASILQEVSQLEIIIDELLQIDRAQLGLLKLERTSFDMGGLVSDTVLRMRTIYNLPGQITMTIPGAPVFGKWDRSRIAMVLINLIDNAIKYSAKPITVELFPTEDEVQIIVTDYGHGITKEEQEQIFEPFYRSARNSEKAAGLGIGLAISNAFVDLHNGAINISSAIGVGTTIVVHLPYH